MDKKMDISVVICTYNRLPVLRLALDSLLAQETEDCFSYEIVVVDDASDDGTGAAVQTICESAAIPMRYVRAEGKGVAEARNKGIEAASGQWVAFTDDDQVNESRWLIELYLLAVETKADCVGGAVALRFDEEPNLQLTPITRSILGEKINPKGRIQALMQCPGTGNVMFHQSVFEKIGVFDTGLAWGGEDADLMLRFLQQGLVAWFTPDSLVHHLIPPYRVKEEYFRWASLRVGVALAEIDHRGRGRFKHAMRCIARIAQAILVNLPRLCIAGIKGDAGRVLETRCLLWRVSTYVRGSLRLLFPALYPHDALLDSLLFRAERKTLAKDE